MTVRVLVVDDEADVETLFRQQFRREVRQGLYSLDFALSGKAALSKLEGYTDEQIILLVSDLESPGMSALEFLSVAHKQWPSLPVLVISDYDDSATKATAQSRGARKFLTKPVDFAQLKQEVSGIIAETESPR